LIKLAENYTKNIRKKDEHCQQDKLKQTISVLHFQFSFINFALLKSAIIEDL